MTVNQATELAYKNGFEAAKEAAVENIRKLIMIPDDLRVAAIAAVRAVTVAGGRTEEPVHWIIGEDNDDFDIQCPVCGWSDVFEVCGIEAVKSIVSELHYCPNCSAKLAVGVAREGK